MAQHESNIDFPAPGKGAFEVTKSNTTVIEASNGLWIGTTGNLTVVFEADYVAGLTYDNQDSVVLTNVPVGLWPFRVKMVLDATTASGIVAIY